MFILEKYDTKINAISGLTNDVSMAFYRGIKAIDNILECHFEHKDIVDRVDSYVSCVVADGGTLDTHEVSYKLKITNVFSQEELKLALGYMLYKKIGKDYGYD